MNNHNAMMHLSNGGEVLVKHEGEWVRVYTPVWSPKRQYIQNDEYVEIRKALADGIKVEFITKKGRQVEINIESTMAKWQLPFIHDVSRYQIVT